MDGLVLLPQVGVGNLVDDGQVPGRGNGFRAEIAVAPFVHIDREGEARDQGSLTNFRVAYFAHFFVGTLQQVLPNPVRYAFAMTRICVVEHEKLSEQQAPVGVYALEQTLPVHVVAATIDQVQRVRHVPAVPFGHEEAMPDELLDRRYADGRGGQDAGSRMLVPRMIDECESVPHAVDQVNELVILVRLGKPVRLLEVHAEARLLERARRGNHLAWLEEEIEILGLAIYSSVLVDRVHAADDERYARPVQRLQRVPVNLALLLWNPEFAVRDGPLLLLRELRVFGRRGAATLLRV